LIAPAAYHRVLFRHKEKHHMVFLANRMALAGLGFLALSIIGVLFVITDVLFGHPAALIVAILAAIAVVGLWFGLPLKRRGVRHNLEED
jgi:hypothetical protein